MNEITTERSYSLAPRNFEEAMKFSELLANSTIVPPSYRGKPGDIMAAMQLGHEIGLGPIQSLQNIAVINGRPCLWGDAMLALVQRHHSFGSIEETDDGFTATCTVRRNGSPAHTVQFSMKDADLAKLTNKPGPWTQYPKRMRQMRARGFALRNQFADALAGLMPAEEVRDYKNINGKVEDPYSDEFETIVIKKEDTEVLKEWKFLMKEYDINEAEILIKSRFSKIEEVPNDTLQKWIEALRSKYNVQATIASEELEESAAKDTLEES